MDYYLWNLSNSSALLTTSLWQTMVDITFTGVNSYKTGLFRKYGL
jgi:hypothetical protein